MATDNQKAVTLVPIAIGDQEAFIRANQEAFNYGALEEFGERHSYFEEDGQIIARSTIQHAMEHGQGYWIYADGQPVGGLILLINGKRGDLDTLFTFPNLHSKGIGQAAWKAVEKAFPEVEVWETMTPYYDKRNIHFYVNRCGFHIVDYYNPFHKEAAFFDDGEHDMLAQFPDGFFRFEKRIR